MGILDSVREGAASFYTSIEEKYYSLMEGLQERGLPAVDWFVSPLENKGIPSLPAAVLLILLLCFGVFLAFAQPGASTLQVFVSSSGAPIAGAEVIVYSGSQEYSALTDAEGIASFESIEQREGALVRVSKAGYSTESESIDLTGNDSISLSLSTESQPQITVFVSDAEGNPVGGALVSFVDPSTAQPLEVTTDATGTAYLSFADENDLFNVRVSRGGFVSERVTCFASQNYCEIKLESESGSGSGSGGSMEPSGAVLITVKDESGSPLEGLVTLMDANSLNIISVKETQADGTAFFQGITTGLSVYLLVEPSNPNYLGYNGGLAGDYQTVAPSQTVEFIVALEPKAQGSSKQIRITVIDSDNEPIKGASVKLYSLESQLTLLDWEETDTAGEVVFEVQDGILAYASIYADGYLPHVERTIVPGDSKTIQLESLAAGNNALLKGLVYDADGEPVQKARVYALTSDGFALGVPFAETLEDGSVILDHLPFQELRLRAVKGSAHGASDAFTPTGEDDFEVIVELEPTYGFVHAKAVDASELGETVNALFEATIDGEVQASCQAEEGECTLEVRSNKQVFVKATASGYADSYSEGFTIATGQTRHQEIPMVPTSMANQLTIINFTMRDSDTGVLVQDLERGNYYDAVLTVNLPSGADKSGFYLRVGDDETVESGAALITYYTAPEGAEVTFGSDYYANASCDYWEQGDDEHKWLNFEFEDGFGVRALSARVFVRPTATKNDEAVFHYRAYAEKNNLWYRNPIDEELNYSESIPGKEYCHAETTTSEYAITQGSTSCNENACLSITLEKNGDYYANALDVPIGHSFSVLLDASFYSASDYPLLTVRAPNEQVIFQQAFFSNSTVQVNDYEFTRALELNDYGYSASGSLSAIAAVPSDYARLTFQLSDEQGVILNAERFVVVSGTGELTLGASPMQLIANDDSDLMLELYSGTLSIEDARLEIEETEGAPFNGLQNGDYYLIGDGSLGNGANGEYEFEDLHPVSPGKFRVIATRDDYAEASIEISVIANDYLSFNPDASSLIVPCTGLSLEVSNDLLVDALVTTAFTDSACITLTGPAITNEGNHTYSFNVPKKDSTILFLEPLKNEDCYLAFNSVLEASGSAFSKTAWVRVDCSELNPTPSPTAQASECSSADCGACTEAECLQLTGYCQPEYITLPDGNQSFQGCIPFETVEPTCSPANCSYCNEAECAQYAECEVSYASGSFECLQAQPLDCSPGNFDFSNMLARRLGQYHANSLFNPTLDNMRIASSASNQIMISSYGYAFTAGGVGCTQEGNTLSCAKPINAMFPVNGMVISIQTTAMQNIDVLVHDENETGCFEFAEVHGETRWGLSRLADELKSALQKTISTITLSPESPYKTYLIVFDGTNPDCVDYAWDNGLKMTPKEGKDTLSLKIQPAGYAGWGATGSAFVNLKVVAEDFDNKASQYALFAVPAHGDIKANEPVFLTANMFDTTTTIKGDGLRVNGVATSNEINLGEAGMAFIEPESEQFTVTVNKVPGTFAFNSFESTGTFQDWVLGMLNNQALTQASTTQEGTEEGESEVTLPSATESGLFSVSFENKGSEEAEDAVLGGSVPGGLACSGTKWCTPEQAELAAEEVAKDLQELYGDFYESLDKVDSSGIVDGSTGIFEQALNDAMNDYIGKQAQYQACKQLGFNPLTQLQEDCAEAYFGPGLNANPTSFQDPNYPSLIAPVPQTWQAPQGFGGVYGDAFSQTACNTELMNYAFGSSQAVGSMGQNFWGTFTGQVTTGLTPYSAEVASGEPIFSMDGLIVIIPMKVAGVGIVPYAFSFDETQARARFERSEWVKIGGINTFMGGPVYSPRLGSVQSFSNNLAPTAPAWYQNAGALPLPYADGEYGIEFTSEVNLYTLNKYPLIIEEGACPECKYWAQTQLPEGGLFQGEAPSYPTIYILEGTSSGVTLNGDSVLVGSDANSQAILACLLDDDKAFNGETDSNLYAITCVSESCTCTEPSVEDGTSEETEEPVDA